MKKIFSWIGYTLLAIIVIAAIIFGSDESPFTLAHPVASVTATGQTVELMQAGIDWLNETDHHVTSVLDTYAFVKNTPDMPVIEVGQGEALQLQLTYRDEERGLYNNVEIDIEAKTDAFFFSETDLFEQTFYELSLDDATYNFYAPEKPGEYALEVEFRLDDGSEEGQFAEYVAKLIVQ